MSKFRALARNKVLPNIREAGSYIISQLKDTFKKASGLSLPLKKFKEVVISGMGGSSIGGDIFRALAFPQSKIPIHILRDYHLPEFVNKDTLVICVSYSGNTEETLQAFKEARARKAPLFAIASGGELEKIALKHKIPFFKIEVKAQPRESLGAMLAVVLALGQKIGLIKINPDDFAFQPDLENKAKEFALSLKNIIPVFVGAEHLAPVARRFKTQINENSKQAAFFEELPELCHNTIAGLDNPSCLSDLCFVLLSSPCYYTRNQKRVKILAEIFNQKKVKHQIWQASRLKNRSKTAEMLNFLSLADALSLELALLNKANPKIVPTIDYLKKRLEKGI
ncbi:bifunctional phosphoglucose/phosphomannose isomerase [Candidatus Berkelbacteria bacterium]|nr:bifunctional phosphoglucose/phosphomannose isomerase [Candidatus Berkelbacteria bacterium]MBI4029725.1 bifunctional phosphoglucose/phosphomannose isomerase [Candidatus Berkelbacteria bacterium]